MFFFTRRAERYLEDLATRILAFGPLINGLMLKYVASGIPRRQALIRVHIDFEEVILPRLADGTFDYAAFEMEHRAWIERAQPELDWTAREAHFHDPRRTPMTLRDLQMRW